jgi:septal ring factor EnvC (AmiA/AmiB activator)
MAYPLTMGDDARAGGFRDAASARAEQLLGGLARDLLDSPSLGSAVGRALEARSKAAQAQEAAMGLLNLPTAGDIERLGRRVRAIGDRLGGIEDTLARVEATLRRHSDQLAGRLDAVERELAAARRELADLESSRIEQPIAVSRDQEVLLRATHVG